MDINVPTTSVTLSVYLSPLTFLALLAHFLSRRHEAPHFSFLSARRRRNRCARSRQREPPQGGTVGSASARKSLLIWLAPFPLPALTFPSTLVSGALTEHCFHVACYGNGHGPVCSPPFTAVLVDLVLLLVYFYLFVVLFVLACLILVCFEFRVRV